MFDPKLLLMLATGTLLLLNGLIARAAAAKSERETPANDEVTPVAASEHEPTDLGPARARKAA